MDVTGPSEAVETLIEQLFGSGGAGTLSLRNIVPEMDVDTGVPAHAHDGAKLLAGDWTEVASCYFPGLSFFSREALLRHFEREHPVMMAAGRHLVEERRRRSVGDLSTWRRRHWGTPEDATQASLVRLSPARAQVTFRTACTPALIALEALAESHSCLAIDIRYATAEGPWSWGWCSYVNGEYLDDRHFPSEHLSPDENTTDYAEFRERHFFGPRAALRSRRSTAQLRVVRI